MKVVFFVHCFFPYHIYGTETYTYELARNYQAMGVDVHIVSAIFPGEKPADRLVSYYEFEGIPVTCVDKNKLRHSRIKDTYYQPEMRPVLTKILQQLKPDIVHVTHLVNHTSVLLEVTKQLNIPAYATFTDFFGFCFNSKLEASDKSLCEGPSPTRSNCIACCMKARKIRGFGRMLQPIARTVGYAHKRMSVFPKGIKKILDDIVERPDTLLSLYSAYECAISPTQFLLDAYKKNGVALPLIRIPFGVDIDRKAKPIRSSNKIPVVGYIGQMARHKGVALLVEAFSRLPKGVAELHIYGPNNQDSRYFDYLKSLVNGASVRFLGTFDKSKTHEIFSTLDLCVIPSRWYENSPLVLLNALATHTPVLISRVAGMMEFVKEGVNGFSFERNNVDDLERVLREALQDKDKLYQLSLTTGYMRTSKMMAEETFSLYENYINNTSVLPG